MTASSRSNKVSICDVGPRDGLQSEKRLWSVDERVEFINKLSQTGLKRIEAVSFVNPKRVPQMADAESVMAKINRPEGVKFVGLALNLKGVERALEAGVDEIRYVVVASETFNQKNQGASIEETMSAFDGIAQTVQASGKRLSGTIGVSFGCPFEGEVPIEKVTSIAKRYADAGVDEIGIADTIGCAVPTQITERVEAVRDVIGEDIDLICHFHNTRNTGIANAAAAVMAGVRLFDASLGGIGGCPFAPRATGNIATEDLAYMLRNMGYDTGIDLNALLDVANWLEGYFPAPLPGQVMKAGLFPEVAQAS
jgi:hydroxymethylglutaryl-CoA lyase